MKVTAGITTGCLFSGSGIIAGNTFFEETTVLKTISEVLEMNNKKILEINGEQDNEGLILAQQYREYGPVLVQGQEKDFKKQKNPNFLSSEDGENYAKDKENFEQDEKLVEALKKRCLNSLNESYSEEFYKDVLRWCRYKIPDYAQDIFKFQKENGNCRLWMVSSTDKQMGGFVGEGLEDIEHDWTENKFVIVLRESLKNDSENEEIKTSCSSNKNKTVELRYYPKEIKGKIAKDEGANKTHKSFIPLFKK